DPFLADIDRSADQCGAHAELACRSLDAHAERCDMASARMLERFQRQLTDDFVAPDRYEVRESFLRRADLAAPVLLGLERQLQRVGEGLAFRIDRVDLRQIPRFDMAYVDTAHCTLRRAGSPGRVREQKYSASIGHGAAARAMAQKFRVFI